MDKLFGNGFPRLMGSNNCFPEINVDVFPPWDCVNTHLNPPGQQTARASAFIKALTLDDDQLINWI